MTSAGIASLPTSLSQLGTDPVYPHGIRSDLAAVGSSSLAVFTSRAGGEAWEPAVLLFPGYLKRLTVAYYLQALVTHEMPQDSPVSALLQVFREVPSVPVSLVSLAVIVGLTLWAAARAVETREYVLEQ